MAAPTITPETGNGHRAMRVLLGDEPRRVGFSERRVSVLEFPDGHCSLNLRHGGSMDAAMWMSRDDLEAVGEAIGRLLGGGR